MHQSIPIFFFNDTATTEIYTLSLHDALPISAADQARQREPEDRYDREQRVAQRVLPDHHALGETLGPRGLDVVLPHDLEHRLPHVAGEPGEPAEGRDQDRQDEVAPEAPLLPPEGEGCPPQRPE